MHGVMFEPAINSDGQKRGNNDKEPAKKCFRAS